MAHYPQEEKVIDQLFRSEYGKLVGVLVKKYGPEHINIIEDAVQETYIKALRSWAHNGIPNYPKAWLHRVARNGTIDTLRKKKLIFDESLLREVPFAEAPLPEEKENEDNQLRLIFLCCNLELDTADIIALTLKIVSGFGVLEIASALSQKEETVKKRIQRARTKLKTYDRESLIKSTNVQETTTALKILYLIFNEGYYSRKAEQLIRKELCIEAMRLTTMLAQHKKYASTTVFALLAQMCYLASRLESRWDKESEIILLKDQDRTSWDQSLIKKGHFFLDKAKFNGKISLYHLEALIAAQHSLAADYESTDWHRLAHLYEILYEYRPFPSIALNLVSIYLENDKLKNAQKLFGKLGLNDFPHHAQFYHAVGSKLALADGNFLLGRKHLEQAIEKSNRSTEKNLLIKKLKEISPSR